MGFVEVKADSLKAAGRRLQGIESALAESNRKVVDEVQPQWRALLGSKASTRLEQRVIAANGRATVIDGGVRLEAGKGGGSLSGGLSVAKAAGPVEYGANRAKRKTYKRKGRRQGVHDVTRRTAAQFRDYNDTGYVFAPAVKAIVPKLSKGWFEGLKVVVSDTIEGN